MVTNAYTQGDVLAVDDTICVQLGEDPNYNVTDNDILPLGATFPVQLFGDTPGECAFLQDDGKFVFFDHSEECCGEYLLQYRYEGCQGIECIGRIFLTIKCPKPECFLVDIEEFSEENNQNPDGSVDCVYACEFSAATYFVNYNPSSTYNWTVSGGTYTSGSNPAEINVNWEQKEVGPFLLL